MLHDLSGAVATEEAEVTTLEYSRDACSDPD